MLRGSRDKDASPQKGNTSSKPTAGAPRFIEVNIVQIVKDSVSDPKPTLVETSHIITIAGAAREGLSRITLDNGEQHFVKESYDELRAVLG